MEEGDLRTTLITTDKDIMYVSSFKYPNSNNKNNLGSIISKKKLKLADQIFFIEDLYFNYDISRDKSLIPMRVFNNGKLIVIERPLYISFEEMPVLILTEDKNGFSLKKKNKLLTLDLLMEDI